MKKEVNCINSDVIIRYVKVYNDGNLVNLLENLDPELDLLPNKEEYLTDKNNWISVDVACKLYERARIIFNNEMTAYNIARYAAENLSLGYGQSIIVKAFGSVEKGLKNLQKINDKWNRTKKVELLNIEKNKAVVRLHWDSEKSLSRDLCLYNQGVYTFMPVVWGGKPLGLEEVCCQFDGAPYCEYKLVWQVRNKISDVFSRFFNSSSVLSETIKEMEIDKALLEKKYEEVNSLNIKLNEKIRQLQAMQETGKAILSVLNLEKLLDVIMNTLSNVCMINRTIIMIVNEKKESIEYLYGTGFDGNTPKEVRNYCVPLERVNNLLVRVANTGRPEYIPDVNSSSLRKENIVLLYGKPSSVFAVPLITRSKVIGVIAVDGIDNTGIPEETRNTLEVFAPQIAIAIENARLYKRLQEQMIELKESNALLNRAEKLSFLGNVAARLAHEIKNPMTAIGTFIQMLPQKFNDEEYRGNFHQIALEEMNRVNNLINEMLDLVNTKESKFELNNLDKLMQKMVLLISPQSRQKKITIDYRFDETIGNLWLDSEKMKQVILNLLSNAVEFTREGGKIEIVANKIMDESEGPVIKIEIKDNGIGISSNDIDKIFDPYFTTKHKSLEHKGTGLGLFIAYQNILDHGGRIDVNSKVNEGATFIITLPDKHSSNRK